MGDVIMSSPAFRALKASFDCKITLLTSSAGNLIAPFISSIDDVIVFNVPWVKTEAQGNAEVLELVQELKQRRFDAAIIFTVLSQNPLPAAMLTYMAGIPIRVGYCRENPYELLTHWVPDREPYEFVQHQVRRDLFLAEVCDAKVEDAPLQLDLGRCKTRIHSIVKKVGIVDDKPWIVVHPGVSEKKREYPEESWIDLLKMVSALDYQIVITGAGSERDLANRIASAVGQNVFSAAGVLDISEFICLIAYSPVVISVNTSTIHIAAATETPVIVLYALTNPQHTPWKALGKVIPFDIPENGRSKNQVIEFLRQEYYRDGVYFPTPSEVFQSLLDVLEDPTTYNIPEVISLQQADLQQLN
jgi:lipopolysaccharide heptosyltransferase II